LLATDRECRGAFCKEDRFDATEIEIPVIGGEVTLLGTVQDRYDKRLAEDLTERVSGVREINNQLLKIEGAGRPLQHLPGSRGPHGPRSRLDRVSATRSARAVVHSGGGAQRF
jgi:hypothetical protein